MIKILFCILVIFTASGCKEQYESPVVPQETGYLVVEGAINSGPGTTIIKLSRTTNLDNIKVQYESGAQVIIEGEDNSTSLLTESIEGQYVISNLNLDKGKTYRLKIITGNGKEYASDFMAILNNPPIDSISWKRENSGVQENGVQLYVSTHDPSGMTRYYQWEYTETWEYHSAFYSILTYEIQTFPNGETTYSLGERDQISQRKMYYCWQSLPSPSIQIGSSAKLSKDEIYQPIGYISPGSEKLGIYYSVNVKQISWSKEGYDFLERMKKNTESTGSVFDPQPSALNGNLYCISNPSEKVIGFVSICPIQEKRIFIDNEELPDWNFKGASCSQVPDTIPNTSDRIARALTQLPTVPYCFPNTICMGTIFFLAADPSCVDCTLKGGSNIKPLFWPR